MKTMKLAECRKAYRDLSGKASDIARHLAFAGIAVVWIFKHGEGLESCVPDDLLLPTILFVVALALDLLHYLVAALTWGGFHLWKERAGTTNEDEFKAPRCVNWVPNLFWAGKFAAVIVGYFLLIKFVWNLWAGNTSQ